MRITLKMKDMPARYKKSKRVVNKDSSGVSREEQRRRTKERANW